MYTETINFNFTPIQAVKKYFRSTIYLGRINWQIVTFALAK